MRTLLEFNPNGVKERESESEKEGKKCTENHPAPTDILTVNFIEPNKREKYGINSFFVSSFVECKRNDEARQTQAHTERHECVPFVLAVIVGKEERT